MIELRGRSQARAAGGELRPDDWVPQPSPVRLWARLGVAATVGLSLLAWALTYSHGLVLAYNDSLSHLDIARQVIDSQQPGLAQLGGVWLPLNQLLYLPLVWINWAWHSGFAGSFVSMAAFVATVCAVYLTVREISDNRAAAALAGAAVALSPNLLYLQATPLTEPLYLALLALAALYFVRYLKSHNPRHVVAMSLFSSLAVAARYDGWFVAGTGALLLLGYELRVHHLAWRRALGVLALYLTPVAFTMGLWLVWNQLLFGSPFYSFVGPSSAHAQQASLQLRAGLITHLNLYRSLQAYSLDVWANLGPWLLLLAGGGWVSFLLVGSGPRWFRLSLLVYFGSEFVFNVVALFLGFSILNLPALHWNPAGTVQGEYFNVRYGITVLPMAAVGVGLLLAPLRAGLVRLARRQRRRHLLRAAPPWLAAALLVVLLGAQAVGMTRQGLITVKDGTIGSSAFSDLDIAQALHRMVRPHQRVLLAESFFNGVILRSGLDARQFVYEGVRRQWAAALVHPAQHVKWLVMASGRVGDPVYASLVVKEHRGFLNDYRLAYAGQHADVYERKPRNGIFVTSHAGGLTDGYTPYVVRGANSYDLAYQNRATIRATLQNLHQAGINTVRFWLFGDGLAQGFQPEAGIINNSRLARVDYILEQAHRDGIRVIPTLTNNWTAYGGIAQYLRWVGLPSSDHDQFFSNQGVIALYENYVRHVVTHMNPLNHLEYGQDPTILAWDIANEPRVDNAADLPHLVSWVGQISRFLHHLDGNQLITVSLDAPTLAQGERSICSQRYIGFCSAHFYPTAAAGSLPGQLQLVDRYRAQAAAARRPIVMTEVGVSKATQPFGKSPLTVLRDSVQRIDRDGYAGWAIWNFAEQPDTSYGFSPAGLQGRYTLGQLHSLAVLTASPRRRSA
ncbi:MAG: cellulase family glycosylhydrolase [Candidatus Dormibacteria bacterium]